MWFQGSKRRALTPREHHSAALDLAQVERVDRRLLGQIARVGHPGREGKLVAARVPHGLVHDPRSTLAEATTV